MKSAVFFERDGILNLVRVEKQQPVPALTLEEFRLNPDAVEPLKALKASGFLLLATTNQPGLSRGYQSRRELDLMHGQLKRRFLLDDVFLCPHDEADDCPCRKPKPGLLTEAAFTYHLDMDRCFVISDKWQDAEAAHNAGCTSVLIKSPWNGSGHHDFVVPNIAAAVAKILQIQPSGNLRAYERAVARA